MAFDPLEFLEKETQVKRKWFISEDELDDDQYNILYAEEDNYLIEGCAGSGKTILALHRLIKIIQSEVETALFLIFTKALKCFIESGVEANIFKQENVEICYSYEALKKINNNELKQFDYIIIDEVQDFEEETLLEILSLCKKNLILFGDDKQQIYVELNKGITLERIRKLAGIERSNHRVLQKNYRLPKQLAFFAGKIVNDNGELYRRCVKEDGQKEIIFKADSFEDEIRKIIQIIENENMTDVGILYPNNAQVKMAKQIFENNFFDIEYKYNISARDKANTLDFNTDIPKIIVYHSSKGLEFETVFLPSCSIYTELHNYKEALYVACTRATKKLYVSYIDSLTPYIKV